MRDEPGLGVRIERCGDGFVARGPRFYLWDDDARALLDTACELAGARKLRASDATSRAPGASPRWPSGRPARRTPRLRGR